MIRWQGPSGNNVKEPPGKSSNDKILTISEISEPDQQIEYKNVSLTMRGHEPNTYNGKPVLIDITQLPGAIEGSVAELWCIDPDGKRKNLYFLVEDLGTSSNVQISVSTTILSLLGIYSRSTVNVRLVSKAAVQLDVVELHFKGTFLTRFDEYRVAKGLTHSCLYASERLTRLGGLLRFTTEVLYRKGRKVFSGYVGPQTRVVFRSDSSRLILLIQMASEMWNFDETGDIMFHRLVNSFFPEMLYRWRRNGDHHLVSIILFTSVGTSDSGSRLVAGELETQCCNFYRVVVDQMHISQWTDIMRTLRQEFATFNREVLVDDENGKLRGSILPSTKGNILEAFSLATTLNTSKFVDKDLCRTTTQIVVATPGSGLFDVNLAQLYQLSKTLLSVEIGAEIVCLARPPLHLTPLFRSTNSDGELIHCVPTWINMSYWGTPDRYIKEWIPRAKIYDIQMMGLIDDDAKMISIRGLTTHSGRLSQRFMRTYDANVFKSVEMMQLQRQVEEASRHPKLTNLLKPKDTAMRQSSAVSSASSSKVVAASRFPGSKTDMSARASLGALLAGNRSHVSSSESSPQLTPFVQQSPAFGDDLDAVLTPLQTQQQSRHQSHSSGSSVPIPVRRSMPSLNGLTPSTRVSQLTSMSRMKPSSSAIFEPTPRIPTDQAKSSAVSITKAQKVQKSQASEKSSAIKNGHRNMWRILRNPSVIDDPSRLTAYGRWANVYPPGKRQSSVNWRSLKSPASLPLTSQSFPTVEEFRQNYKFQFYDIAVDTDEMTAGELIEEMLGFRLQLGFQIAVGSAVQRVEATMPRGNPGMISQTVPENSNAPLGLRLYLTRMGLIHRIALDYDNTINVQLYTWVDPDQSLARQQVNPSQNIFVKAKYDETYRPIDAKFVDMRWLSHLNWSQLDQQLAGSEDPLDNPNNLVKTRYVLIPVEGDREIQIQGLTPEELRVEGISRVVQVLLKNKYPPEKAQNFPVHFYTGSLSRAVDELLESGNSSAVSLQNDRLSRDISLSDLAKEMKGRMGVPFRDRRWHWKVFHQAFLGHDFATWLVRTFRDINNYEEAVDYARHLEKMELFSHVERRHEFMNGHYFYTLLSPYDSNPANTPNRKSQDDRQSRGKILLSESVRIDVDPKNLSERQEHINVHIDRVHNPKHAFHFHVEWLNATPRLVDEMFTGLGRIAQGYGLKMVQISVAEVSRSLGKSPFRSVQRLEFCYPPPVMESKYSVQHYFLVTNGFVCDIDEVESSNIGIGYSWGPIENLQYIHNSGTVLAQVMEDGSICMAINILYFSRLSMLNPSAAAVSEADKIIDELKALCQDKKFTENMFEAALRKKRS